MIQKSKKGKGGSYEKYNFFRGYINNFSNSFINFNMTISVG